MNEFPWRLGPSAPPDPFEPVRHPTGCTCPDPVHDSEGPRCVHCAQLLRPDDGEEVCRFCQPHYSKRRGVNGMYAPRCGACVEGREHGSEDLQPV